MSRFYPFTKQNSKDDITNKLAFYKHKNGKELGLSGKLAMILPPGAPPELPDAIGSFTNVKSIDISQNFLRALTPRIAQLQGNLTELNASHNMLTDVSEVALLTALNTLNLSYNSMRPSHLTPLSSLVHLKELHISHNLLSSDDPHPETSAPLEVSADTETTPITRRSSLSPTRLQLIFTPHLSQPQRKLASAPPTISTSPPTSPLETSIETSTETSTETSDDGDLSSTSPPRLTSSPVALLLTPTPIHPGSSKQSPFPPRSRTPSPIQLEPPAAPVPANNPVLPHAPSPIPSPHQSPLLFTHFAHLEVLILSSNHLHMFPDVHALVSLVKLDVSENKIVEVPAGIHTQLVNLKELNLQSNLIEKLPPMMKSLKKLLVDKNPLHPAFLILAENGDLLNQLQATPEVAIPRSSSESSIPNLMETTPIPLRSVTPPPNGFLSRIFRKDHSNSEQISPKGKTQPVSVPATPEDSTNATATSPESQLQSVSHLPDGATATSDSSDSTRELSESDKAANEILKKKRAVSLPQSPHLRIPPSPLFGIPPMLSFPSSPPDQPSPTEVYLEFVKRLKQAPNLKSSIDSFVDRIKNRSLDPDDLQAALRDFVHNTHTTLSEHPLWKKASAHELQEAELHLQEYVLEHLYDHIFAARQEDKEKDREINHLIRRFYFITPEHLDISVLREHEDIWRRAEQQILQINSTRSVRSKMRCVVRMCRDLITALARAHGDSLGADVLLPHLIFVILHANPPRLHSNIVYMTRFSESEASETIYYVTQLVAALYFIEHIEAPSLNIDPDEFQLRMNEMSRVPSSRADTPTPARARMTRSGSSIVFTPDVITTLARALDLKRKEYTLLQSHGDAAKWIADNDALINQCVGLSREVLPTLPTVSSAPPPPPPRFEGIRLEDLRASEIPQLLEDYHRLASLFHPPTPHLPLPLLPLPLLPPPLPTVPHAWHLCPSPSPPLNTPPTHPLHPLSS